MFIPKETHFDDFYNNKQIQKIIFSKFHRARVTET